MAKKGSGKNMEAWTPGVAEFGIQTSQPVDFTESTAVSLPANATINGQSISNGLLYDSAEVAAKVSPFVTTYGSNFYLKGQQFRFVGMNYYPLTLPGTTTANVKNFFDACRKKNITVVRCWCFDSPDNFRSLVYPLGTPNSITNGEFETDTTGWTLASEFTRSNDFANAGTYSLKQNSAAGTYTSATFAATVTANTNYTWTFWYKLTQTSGGQNQFPTRQIIGTTSGGSEITNGGILPTSTTFVERQTSFNSGNNTTIYLTLQNWGGANIGYFDTMDLSPTQTPTIGYNEASFVRIDVILDEARKRGIKVIFSLADGNEDNYNTKGTYVSWANSIYNAGLSHTYPYLGFFTSSYCQQLYKDFIDKITSRVNTINGLTYYNDPSIFSWELGNELRTNYFDPGNVVNSLQAPNLARLSSPGGWADIMSTYIKTKDPNHMVNFGDMAHTWQFATGDTVSNGTFYGVDYGILSALPNIDFADFHIYPDQADAIHLQKYGQRLGYPNSVSAAGFRAQLADFVNVPHALGKPAILGELGFVSSTTGDNTYYPLYNRYAAFKAIFQDFLDTDLGDGIIPWHAVPATTSGSYDIALNAYGGEALTDNTDDTTLINLIKQYNDKFQMNILASEGETDPKYLQTAIPQILATSGTISVDTAKGFIQQTPAGATTFNAASVGPLGTYLIFEITTSGTSSYTLTFGTNFKSTGTLATGTSSAKIFIVTFISDGVGYKEISRTAAM